MAALVLGMSFQGQGMVDHCMGRSLGSDWIPPRNFRGRSGEDWNGPWMDWNGRLGGTEGGPQLGSVRMHRGRTGGDGGRDQTVAGLEARHQQ